MKTRLRILLSILFFIIIYAGYFWGIPAIVDIENNVPIIEKSIKKEFGADIRLEKPRLKMGLIPAVWLDAKYFGIEDNIKSPLAINNLKLKIKLLPLLFGKVNIAYFSCDSISADLKIDKKYRLYIGNYLFIKTSDSRLSFENSNMEIGKYNINLFDQARDKKIFFDGQYLELNDFNPKKHLNFSTNSQIKIGNRVSKIDFDIDMKLPLKAGLSTNQIVFDGSIANLNLADFSHYIKRISNNQITDINGILNIQALTRELNLRKTEINSELTVDNLKISLDKHVLPMYNNGKLKLKTKLNLSKNAIDIKDFSILSDKINTKISGKIKNVDSKAPHLDIIANVGNSRAENLIALLPAVTSNGADINVVALKKYGFFGDVNGDLRIKGKFGKPYIAGEVDITNGYVIKPLNIKKATVKLGFLNDELFMDIFVPVNGNENITVKGTLEFYDKKNTNLDISSTQNADLSIVKFILDPVHEMFNFDIGPIPVMKLNGLGNINLKVDGNKAAPHLFGALNFKNVTASFNGINAVVENVNATLRFEDQNTIFKTQKALFDKKLIKINGTCNLLGDLNYSIEAENQSLVKMINIIKSSPLLTGLQNDFELPNKASGKVNLKLNLKGRIKSIDDFAIGKTLQVSGMIKLLGNDLSISNLKIMLKNLTGTIKFKNTDADFDLYSNNAKSKMHIKGTVKDKKIRSKIKLDDLIFEYSGIPVKIFSGNIEIDNEKLTLYRINGLLDTMPVLVDGYATDIFKAQPYFDIYINSKPSQKFIDKYLNKNATYPLKVKGDIIYSARISGNKDSFDTRAEINLQEDANIYYMGATLGDTQNPIRIFIDTNISKNNLNIKNFQYDKLITSQNNREFVSQQLNAKGNIKFDKNNITLGNFRVRTQNPTDTKIFNILFKKPLIKEGLFNSNISINGPINSPNLIGMLNFTGLNIPLLDTTIKDISLDFKRDYIEISSKGELFGNKVVLFANMVNKLSPPYYLQDVDVYLGNLDINEASKTISKLEFEPNNQITEQNMPFAISDLIIRNGKVKAESVFVKTIFAKDLSADFSLNEKMLFSVNNFNFSVAQGNIKGDFTHNLLSSKTNLDIDVSKVNANSIAESLFDLPNQIFGSLYGQANLTCNGKTHKTCMNTLTGNGGFRVVDGKMPKLGSLEYLLKAANLVKSGVTGLTINSIVELITPLKTGNFENINGLFNIKSGFADDIQIYSRGKDLSLFLTGTYNFPNQLANMEVFGRISKKISNVLGPVGNTSLNTLFNTIPGLNLDDTNKADFVKNLNKIPGFELNDKTYRVFSAEIYGDINSENYVKSFKWVE